MKKTALIIGMVLLAAMITTALVSTSISAEQITQPATCGCDESIYCGCGGNCGCATGECGCKSGCHS